MPRKKYYGRKKGYYRRKGKSKFRRYTASSKKRSQIISVWKRQVRAKDPVPLERYCVLKYHDAFTWTTVGGFAVQVMRGNSLFDPDYTTGGAQPLGYDQLSGLYNRFIVFGSSIKVTVISSDDVGMIVVLAKSYLPTTMTNAFTAAERPDSKIRYLGKSGSNRDTVVLKSFAKTGTVLGFKDVEDEENLSHTYGTDPTSQWFWHIYFENDDAGNLSCQCIVEMKYYALMTNRTHLQRS